MQSFTKPKNLDGAILVQELEGAGIKVKANKINTKCPSVDGNGLLWLDIDADDKSAADLIITNHTA